MVQVRLIEVCAERRLFWDADVEEARCADPGHDHQRHEVHRHLDAVALPGGTSVTAVSFDPTDPYRRSEPPDHGLYLDARWSPPWPHDHLDWPDFGVPADRDAVMSALQTFVERARAGKRVELGCLGGHGRTGTALACLAVLSGLPAAEAVSWVRTAYCPQAVETAEQQAFVDDPPA